MTKQELKKLEDDLWDSANTLRATGGIKSADYAVPVLGIIFLRFADNKYGLVEEVVNKEFEQNQGTRMEVPKKDIAKRLCGLYLSPKSRYEYLLHLPTSQSIAQAIKEAMEDIESHQDEQFKEILPKDAYAQIEKNSPDILPKLIKTFSDIPATASGDVFGKIYEYFLGKFALSEGQKGGEFFTPTSVVKFIVESIEPYKGKIFDPACGSGGMFVQSANFIDKSNKNREDIKRENIVVYGQEHERATVKLAKMNLLVNNLRGEIKKANSYEDNPFKSEGKFDFVMANPPFNVKGVKESTVKGDSRFTKYGLPKSKGKKDDKITDANYLWISLFATSLNSNGRAGFVMPNSASDARNSEYDIRKKIVDEGLVDCMVSIPSNMFYTVTLPATLWFFDRKKIEKDKILFIDARNVYTQIDRAHREWSEEQVQNLASIVRLHRGERERYLELVAGYLKSFESDYLVFKTFIERYVETYNVYTVALDSYQIMSSLKRKKEAQKKLDSSGLLAKLEAMGELEKVAFSDIDFSLDLSSNEYQIDLGQQISETIKVIRDEVKNLKGIESARVEISKESAKLLRIKGDAMWEGSEFSALVSMLDENAVSMVESFEKLSYWHENIHWLQSRFPNAEYVDVLGLCKVADRSEYVEEQDYSLNAGRYVGIELEEDNLTADEFRDLILEKHEVLVGLNEEALELEALIDTTLGKLF